jgi:TolB-like protein
LARRGVDYVLDGRIKTLGNRARVSLQLLDAALPLDVRKAFGFP